MDIDNTLCEYPDPLLYQDCDGNCLIDFDNDGVCDQVEVYGCTYSWAYNFNPQATNDDGTCVEREFGCIDNTACNFDTTANTDDGSCYNNDLGCGCDTPGAEAGYDCNGVCLADADGDGICDEFEILGCVDDTAFNYDTSATDDDGSCVPIVTGCIDNTACNFDATANTDDGSCYNNDLGCGCDTPGAEVGYDCSGVCLADADGDGVCDEFEVVGCQEATADNYNSEATDEGACEYLGCIDNTACNLTLLQIQMMVHVTIMT